MDYLVVPIVVRARLGESGSEGLVDMFSAYQQFSERDSILISAWRSHLRQSNSSQIWSWPPVRGRCGLTR